MPVSGSKFFYQCSTCGKTYPSDKIIYLCPVCSKGNTKTLPPKGVLSTIYRYGEIKKRYQGQPLFKALQAKTFIDLLPIEARESLGYLRVGNTPLYKINNLEGKDLMGELYLKDDSQNPTFSFKDRASVLVSAFAKERGIDTIITASTGNAGCSLAGICASQQQKAIVLVPESAPPAKLIQVKMYGAQLIPVKGNYGKAFDQSIEMTEKDGYYNRNTAYNPLTIEGKKTVSFELFDQLGQCIPDRIFVPTGDGVILSGVYKGFEDLWMLGIIEKMPVVVAVQPQKSDNLIRNLHAETFQSIPSSTVADSISVDVPRNFFQSKHYLQKYDGEWIAVSDEEILLASRTLSRNTGLFTEPASAAAFAAFLKYQQEHLMPPGSKNVVLLTGCGLKDLKAVNSITI
ncbi:MAG: threonine synthase [Bacteroidetes bacterium]|nr:threonine synthase [Bacteroidota bacterium]